MLGQEFPLPVMLAPIGTQSLFHDDELATVRAAADLDVTLALTGHDAASVDRSAVVRRDGL